MATSFCTASASRSILAANHLQVEFNPLFRADSSGRLCRLSPLVRCKLSPNMPSSLTTPSERSSHFLKSSDSSGPLNTTISQGMLLNGCSHSLSKKNVFTCSATAESGALEPSEPKSLAAKFPGLVTGFYFFMWYLLNVIFNILNKKIYNYFPYPYFVSTIHLVVGVAYCLISWALGFPKRAPIDSKLLWALVPVAFCHSLGHLMTNVSFTAVAVSFTHTVKSLEPFFSALGQQFILGQVVPLSLWLSLAPVVVGVSMASMTELSFNWIGFLTAMSSNISFTYRNIFSKKAMTNMDSTNLYAYISILSVLMCIPCAIAIEGPRLIKYGFADVIQKVGVTKFVSDLFLVGMFYHLYNQLAINTLERVAPLTHAVGNVLKRVFVIGFSIVIFGNRISAQTGVGTMIAIIGVTIYSLLKAKIEEDKRKAITKPKSA